uniref:Farnesyl diphosphate synthase n=1 Tax=Candidatus Kentrum sp. MB TaxID=2138164 RepID=A0A450WZE5_9GAMM|nr:MAG: farnesyl diphosphate synthase [Candidatus Kentron sp. MB]VFK28764.1 MAG: farnesyl diphosphate synthase [Candidatus Kentron sp. MB]VFK74082.1 MAG: farnesyl diphosphate synthase [Candidatus Kentron sp. MB]
MGICYPHDGGKQIHRTINSPIRCRIMNMTKESLPDLMERYRARVNQCLDAYLPSADILPNRLHTAMRYIVLGDGKRIRPILVYCAGKAVGAPLEALDGPACAVELIHAYSLVHDDLPAMDNDDLRRGKPTCHRAFDEATAILVGDALQSLAFYALSKKGPETTDPDQKIEMLNTLALASGSRGMAGGQALDLEAETKTLNLAELENLHIHKTGALIRASVKLGGLSKPGVDRNLLEKLDHYAKCIGLSFQIRDDILDVEGDTEILGKPSGSDQARHKATYPSLLGVSEAKRMAWEFHQQALSSLADLDESADPLRWLSEYIVNRIN